MADRATSDLIDHLDNKKFVAEHLSAAAEDPNADVFLSALAIIARARGMAQVAKNAGLGRESLYKALAPDAHPRFETVRAVLRALNLRLVLVPDSERRS